MSEAGKSPYGNFSNSDETTIRDRWLHGHAPRLSHFWKQFINERLHDTTTDETVYGRKLMIDNWMLWISRRQTGTKSGRRSKRLAQSPSKSRSLWSQTSSRSRQSKATMRAAPVTTEYLSQKRRQQIVRGFGDNGFYTKFYEGELGLISAVAEQRVHPAAAAKKIDSCTASPKVAPASAVVTRTSLLQAATNPNLQFRHLCPVSGAP